jgi:hypothetical protein
MSGIGGQPCVAHGPSGSTFLSVMCESSVLPWGKSNPVTARRAVASSGSPGKATGFLFGPYRVVSVHHETRHMSHCGALKTLEHLVANQPNVGAL